MVICVKTILGVYYCHMCCCFLVASTSPTPTQQSDDPNALTSIIAVVGGAFGIMVLVAVGAFVYFIFRRIRLKKLKKQEETDYAPLVHYNVSENEDDINVELKQK